MLHDYTDEELDAMDLATAETEISNAVYAATALIERLENRKKIRGNGHHARQAVAMFGVQEVRTRWNNENEAKLRAAQTNITAASLSAQKL